MVQLHLTEDRTLDRKVSRTRSRELEKSLKTTCEEFIMSVTKLVVEPLLSFVTKVTAVKVALSGSQNQKLESGIAKPLKDHAFASPEKIAELLQKVNTAIDEDLPRVLVKMRLYLQNSSTRAILFKPINLEVLKEMLLQASDTILIIASNTCAGCVEQMHRRRPCCCWHMGVHEGSDAGGACWGVLA
ncbi:hypothetical protein KY290_020470 [Solanum tuberosum]|uniref:Uncharacterized protein n=1 Tax=Solanum tuberosum TaxID=4113 RepID=A0ABQ7UYU4_SOLTU|nr:hypothetical protein KY290_020470 [Solanum tuberosum]